MIPPSIAHRYRLGWSVDRFSHFCSGFIGRPGPSTSAEDQKVASELAHEEPSSVRFADRKVEWPAPVPGEVSLRSVANRYRAHCGRSMVDAMKELTGCDMSDRNPTPDEILRFSKWLDATFKRDWASDRKENHGTN